VGWADYVRGATPGRGACSSASGSFCAGTCGRTSRCRWATRSCSWTPSERQGGRAWRHSGRWTQCTHPLPHCVGVRSVVFTGAAPALSYLITHRLATGDGFSLPDVQLISGGCASGVGSHERGTTSPLPSPPPPARADMEHCGAEVRWRAWACSRAGGCLCAFPARLASITPPTTPPPSPGPHAQVHELYWLSHRQWMTNTVRHWYAQGRSMPCPLQ
jgi:hypothetical protein